MKYRLYITTLALMAIAMSCEKQVNVRTSFPFSVKSDLKGALVVNTLSKTSFDIAPEQVVTTNVYTMAYRVISGEGSFYTTTDKALKEGEALEIEGLDLDVFFMASTVGEIEVEVFFSDQQGEGATKVLKYVSTDNPFTVELNTIGTSATVDQGKDFTLILANTGEDKKVAYTASLFLSQGVGTIDLLNKDGEVVVRVGQNETFQILPGTYNYSVTLANDGVNILKVNIVDSNGQKMSDSIELAVNVVNYNFTGEPTANATAIGNDVELNFNLFETDGGNADYEMRYILRGGDVDIFSGATPVSAGTNIDVTLGAFSWLFRPTEIGEVTLQFVARNSTGVEKEIVITIDVQDRNFDFTATRSLANLPLGGNVAINYVITESGGNQKDGYTMTYTTSNNGTLSIGSQVFSPGTVITLPSLSFEAIYTGTSPGTHTIKSLITATSNGRAVTKEVETEYLASEFTFDITSDTQLTVGDRIDLTVILNETIGSSDFDFKYSITGVAQKFSDAAGIVREPNIDYDVQSNSFIWGIEAIRQGEMNVTYTAVNQFGVVKTKTIRYTIKPIDFNYNVGIEGTNFLTDKPIRFDFDMDAPTTLTYQLSFTSNASTAKIEYLGKSYSANEKISIINTDFNLNYITKNSSSNVINWTITASNGVVKRDTSTIEVQQIPVINGVIKTVSSPCSSRNFVYTFEAEVTKGNNSTITSITYRLLDPDGSEFKSETEEKNQPNTQNSATASTDCINRFFWSDRKGSGFNIEVTVRDSNGYTSNTFKQSY